MDKFGIVSLKYIEGVISDLEESIKTSPAAIASTLVGAEIAYKDIRELCSKLPSAEDCFIEGYESANPANKNTFENYITNYKP